MPPMPCPPGSDVRMSEAANPLTFALDAHGPDGIVKALRAADAQIFSGYGATSTSGADDGLADERIVASVAQLAGAVAAARAAGGGVLVGGSGTSGRVAYLMAQRYGSEVSYCISGGDSAICFSDEAPEDDPDLGRAHVQAALDALPAGAPLVVIGVSCGLSAPYVAGMLSASLAIPGCDPGHTFAVGFNPLSQARAATIEKWRDLPDGCARSFADVARMLAPGCLVNPVVGPEPLTASSRMKGGSATYMILDAALAASELSDAAARRESVQLRIEAFERCCGRAYRAAGLRELVAAAGAALRRSAHVYYVGAAADGALGVMDVSEMPDTYGAAFDEMRAFVAGGWTTMLGGDRDKASALHARSPLHRIGLADFSHDVLPSLTADDLVVVLWSDVPAPSEEAAELAALCSAVAAQQGRAPACVAVRAAAAAPPPAPCAPPVPASVTVRVADLHPAVGEEGSQSTAARAVADMALKWVLNAVSTGAQVLNGKVFRNRMINTGPTNNKLYFRCIELVQLLAKVGPKEAEHALLKSLYDVDALDAATLAKPVSAHVEAATPAEEDRMDQQLVLSTAIVLALGGQGATLAAAKAALAAAPCLADAMRTQSAE